MLMCDPRKVVHRSARGLRLLGVVTCAVLAASCGGAGSGAAGGVPGGTAAGEPGGPSGVAGLPQVALDGLAGGRYARGGEGRRNPFSFGSAPAPATPAPAAVPRPSVRPVTPPTRPTIQQVPTSAGPGRAVTLKFIGTLDGESVGRVAVLSDDGAVFHGRAGEIVDGRYRIVRIGIESIEVEVVADGRRVTVRLSGS